MKIILKRLLTKMPAYLARTDVTQKHAEVLVKCVGELTKYIQGNLTKCFGESPYVKAAAAAAVFLD